VIKPQGVKRSVRVAERIREEVARALARDLSDPRLSYAVVTRVEVPDDLSLARIFVRLATGGDDAAARERLLSGLGAAKGFLRKLVGSSVGLRRAPELRFQYDEGQDASQRIDEILHEIERDRASKPDGES
jgi:ribosome-binding factor A